MSLRTYSFFSAPTKPVLRIRHQCAHQHVPELPAVRLQANMRPHQKVATWLPAREFSASWTHFGFSKKLQMPSAQPTKSLPRRGAENALPKPNSQVVPATADMGPPPKGDHQEPKLAPAQRRRPTLERSMSGRPRNSLVLDRCWRFPCHVVFSISASV